MSSEFPNFIAWGHLGATCFVHHSYNNKNIDNNILIHVHVVKIAISAIYPHLKIISDYMNFMKLTQMLSNIRGHANSVLLIF